MKNLIHYINSSKKSFSVIAIVVDKKIKFVAFKIKKKIGEEQGWITAGNKSKINERFRILQGNVSDFEKEIIHFDKDVLEIVDYEMEISSDKLKTIRKIIEVFDGFNCPSNKLTKVNVDGIEYELDEWVQKYLL